MGATARLCGFLLIAALAGCAQNPGLPKLALFGSDDSGETGGTIQHDEADPAGGPPMPVRNERRRLAGKSTTADGEAQPSGLLVAFWAWRKKPAGRLRSDAWLLKSAGIGRFIASQEILRITQTLSLLLENGITTIPALAMTERTLQNRVLRASFAEARAKIAEGAPISGALQAMGHFPALVIDVLTVGENTGDIVPSLKEIARVYRRQITSDVNVFLNVVSITVLLVAFAFVALIAFGIILAVLQLSASLRVR
jgi:hypothetical protein